MKDIKMIYNAQEHFSCVNYESSNHAVIERLPLNKGDRFTDSSEYDKLFFVLEGSLMVGINGNVEHNVPNNSIFLKPAVKRYAISVCEDSLLIIVRLFGKPQFCDCFKAEHLIKVNNMEMEEILNEHRDENKPYVLDVNRQMRMFLDLLEVSINSGLKCRFYLQDKVKEMFYMFRAFYKKKELYLMFEPVVHADSTFTSFVIQNYHKYKTVKELAVAMNCSVSTLEKRFKNAFGVYAYTWMKDRRAQSVLHAIASPERNFKEIAFDYGFSSQAYFTSFCKAEFGKTPTDIRKDIKQVLPQTSE